MRALSISWLFVCESTHNSQSTGSGEERKARDACKGRTHLMVRHLCCSFFSNSRKVCERPHPCGEIKWYDSCIQQKLDAER